MSNIDKQALRNLARRATPGPWAMEHENIWYYENGYTKHLAYFCQGDDVDDSQDDVNTRYVAAADPSTVLALLDELEKMQAQSSKWCEAFHKAVSVGARYEERIAELEAKLDSADKLQDSAFRHGLQHGFSLGQTDNQAGFEECLSAYGTGKGE
ncbi:TPA: ead/Ea22-like family protein [Enterobacter asburiae]